MRRVPEGVLALLLLAPALWALDDTKDSRKSDTRSSAQGNTPAEQYRTIIADAQKELQDFFQAYKKATPEERQQLQYPRPYKYAERMLDLAENNAKTPAAADALAWVVQNAGVGSQEGKKALAVLLRDHAESKQLAGICPYLRYAGPDGEKNLRTILEKTREPEVEAQARFALGQYLKDKAQRTNGPSAEAESLFERVAEEYPNVEIYGRKLGALAKGELFELHNLAIGKVAPEIEGEDTDGKKFKLSDYRGKVVLLYFWGNWLDSCRAMYPHERAIVNKLQGKPFVLLGINSDSNREELKKVLEKEQLIWRSWWDGGGGPIASQWNVQGWPTLYLVDHKGVIVDKSVGYRDMDRRIEQLVVEVQAGPKGRAKLPEGISEITSTDLLTKVPNFFSFDYPGFPHPGKRYWLRIDNKYWIERYPDGMESKFKILGRATVRGNSGTVAVKIEGDVQKTLTDNEGGFQVFIPDKGAQDMAILIRHLGTADSEWRNLAGIEKVD